jgi:hypothetical protein
MFFRLTDFKILFVTKGGFFVCDFHCTKIKAYYDFFGYFWQVVQQARWFGASGALARADNFCPIEKLVFSRASVVECPACKPSPWALQAMPDSASNG